MLVLLSASLPAHLFTASFNLQTTDDALPASCKYQNL